MEKISEIITTLVPLLSTIVGGGIALLSAFALQRDKERKERKDEIRRAKKAVTESLHRVSHFLKEAESATQPSKIQEMHPPLELSLLTFYTSEYFHPISCNARELYDEVWVYFSFLVNCCKDDERTAAESFKEWDIKMMAGYHERMNKHRSAIEDFLTKA